MHHVWYCIKAGSTSVKPIHIERLDEAAFPLTKLLLLDWTRSFHTRSRSYSCLANLSKYSKSFLSKTFTAGASNADVSNLFLKAARYSRFYLGLETLLVIVS